MKTVPFYTVIFENEHFIAVNKMPGISVGADRYDESKERLDKLIEQDLKIPKIYTVHRIDKETSGLVIFAKDSKTHRELSIAFENRKIEKRYIVVVHGRPSWEEIVCDLPLVANGNKKHMTIVDKFRGKESATRFILLTSCAHYSVLEAQPLTGRIHQIRVHAVSTGHPVVCDALYGKESPVKLSSFKRGWRGDPFEEKPLLSRLGLHALEITLPGGQILNAPLHRDMSSLINQLEKQKN